MSKKIKNLLLGLAVLLVTTGLGSSASYAACAAGETCGQGTTATSSNSNSSGTTDKGACSNLSGSEQAACINCNGTSPASDCVCHPEYQVGGSSLTPSQYTNCEACNNGTKNGQVCLAHNPIVNDINDIVNVLAGLVGTVAVAMIVIGGIRYSLGRNDPSAIGAARKHIANAVVALIAFFLIWAFLQWIVPGGVFNS